MKPMTIILIVAMAVVYLAMRATSASDTTVVFAFAGVIIFMPFVAGPILIRYNHRHSVHPQLEPKAPQDMPNVASEFFQHATRDLANEGFTAWPEFSHRMMNATMYLKLFLNREAGDSITAAAIYANPKEASRLRSKALIITTRIDDGQRYTTSNASVLGVFCQLPERHGLYVPQIQDNIQLYKIHRAWLHKVAPAGRSVLPIEGQEVASITEEMTDTLARQVEMGLFHIDHVSNTYRPTWKGAVLMTWKVCWPVKQLRKACRVRKDRTTVHALGF